MATPRPTRRPNLEVHLGAGGLVVGRLHLGSGRRSAFSYDEGWLQDARFFTLSPDLQPVAGVQHPRQAFFLALEDTAPDVWGLGMRGTDLQDFEPAFAQEGGADT
ncbi:hypothetical protein [Castellaniella sp.]|uniref:hypothetical protein n=1 Tax=Castellaniella sp. TaxID=1955812 RepID=UPI00355F88AD